MNLYLLNKLSLSKNICLIVKCLLSIDNIVKTTMSDRLSVILLVEPKLVNHF